MHTQLADALDKALEPKVKAPEEMTDTELLGEEQRSAAQVVKARERADNLEANHDDICTEVAKRKLEDIPDAVSR